MIVDKGVKEYSGANTVFSINSAGTAGQPHAKKKKACTDLLPFRKINSEQIRDPNEKNKI